MITSARNYLKFLLKIKIIGSLRSLFLILVPPPVNPEGSSGNILLINLLGLGDLIVFTGVLKHYKKAYPNKKIYLLTKTENQVEKIFEKDFVDKVIPLNYRKFATNPFYGYKVIKNLKKIGFDVVINQDFSAAEILGKVLSLKLGAKKVISYEGMAIEFLRPFDSHQQKNLRFFSQKILPKFNQVIPRIDYHSDLLNFLPSALEHYIAIFEVATGFRADDYSTFIPSQSENKIPTTNYAVFNLNASVSYKQWPIDRFAAVAEKVKEQGIEIVLVGSLKEKAKLEEFKKFYPHSFIDLVGQTSLEELSALIRESKFVISGDTSIVHLAIALKKPTLCPAGGGQFGMFTDYGYRAINHWAYKRSKCFCDNWHCGREAKNGKPSACLDAVDLNLVLEKLDKILEVSKNPLIHQEANFETSFNQISQKNTAKIKIVFSGVQFENYNFNRISFEYSNFLSTLRAMPDIDVLFYPSDFILQMGKAAFNRELLNLIKREKPDLFFAFMYTDELDKNILEKIKGITKSVAWFADDHWRLDSYSRFYAPYFTKAITTWSEGVKNYERYGINNIIRSQWACNHLVWQPAVALEDIDVSFVGQYNSARGKIVQALRSLGVDIWVRGWGWPEGRLPGGDMIQAFSRSRINLNFNTPPNRWDPKLLARLFFKRSLNKIRINWHPISNFRSWLNTSIPQIKARPFEVAGCKAFLISAFADDVDHYYEDKKESVYYRDIPDLVEKIGFYLQNPELRKQIAQAGYERTLKEHTYMKRFASILKQVGINYEA